MSFKVAKCVQYMQVLLIGLLLFSGCKETASIHHQLQIRMDPQDGYLLVRNNLIIHPFPQFAKKSLIRFALPSRHQSSKVSWVNFQQKRLGLYITTQNNKPEEDNSSLSTISIQKPDYQIWPKRLEMFISYRIPLSHTSKGTKDPGYFLSDFYPKILIQQNALPSLVTFTLRTDTPEDWKTVSQGERLEEKVQNGRRHTVWTSLKPMEEIYLAVDRFLEYKKEEKGRKMYAFLRDSNPHLAQQYLDITGPYIDFYEKLIGPYPYKKFALIENAEQTGYGMPSFTLLGSRIIRLPFIIHTSFPHEILHNWWGNGVYIDPRFGNWAEGLTTYLADHLLVELKGRGSRYRFEQLVRYRNYVSESKDFPLKEFTSRLDMASQAVGYGKMLMLFHMLRREIGEERFIQTLQRFYAASRFQYANLEDIREAFELTSGQNLKPFFLQWATRSGAPELGLANAELVSVGKGFRLHLDIRQYQTGPPFSFTLPIGIWNKNTRDSKSEFRLIKVLIDQSFQSIYLNLSEKPGKVILDPYHDIFQKLDQKDIPPSIGQTYGADKATIIQSSQSTGDAASLFTQSLSQASKNITQTKNDSHSMDLPSEALWIVGKNNEVGKRLIDQLKKHLIFIFDGGMVVDGKKYPWEGHSFVFTLKHPTSKELTATWVIPESSKAVSGLIRKLPHYGKFGYMVFEGEKSQNRAKGTWPANRNRLTKIFQAGLYPLPTPPPLVNYQPQLPTQ